MTVIALFPTVSLKPFAQPIIDFSGSKLMAAGKTGCFARLIKYDPPYCDTMVRRWQAYTGKPATLGSTEQKLYQVDEVRNGIVLETAEVAE